MDSMPLLILWTATSYSTCLSRSLNTNPLGLYVPRSLKLANEQALWHGQFDSTELLDFCSSETLFFIPLLDSSQYQQDHIALSSTCSIKLHGMPMDWLKRQNATQIHVGSAASIPQLHGSSLTSPNISSSDPFHYCLYISSHFWCFRESGALDLCASMILTLAHECSWPTRSPHGRCNTKGHPF